MTACEDVDFWSRAQGAALTLQILQVADLDVSRSEILDVLLHGLGRCSCLDWKGIAVRFEVLVVPFRGQDLWERFQSVWELPLISIDCSGRLVASRFLFL